MRGTGQCCLEQEELGCSSSAGVRVRYIEWGFLFVFFFFVLFSLSPICITKFVENGLSFLSLDV